MNAEERQAEIERLEKLAAKRRGKPGMAENVAEIQKRIDQVSKLGVRQTRYESDEGRYWQR